MSGGLDLAQPWALLLLPLALLPLLRSRRDTLPFSSLAWLPKDRIGRVAGFAWRALAVLTILTTVLALAGPGRGETQVLRTGRGAEILLLIDRSRSMDDRMLTSDWQTLDPLVVRAQAWSRGEQKGAVARELLSKFVAERPDDRFSLMFFSANPIPAVPFTQHDEVIQAGITAAGVGRGLSDTDVGWALISAIKAFDQRAYSGSRIILLVSDGGAQLEDATRRQIRAGLQQNRIALNWIYLRSVNGPKLDSSDGDGQSEGMAEIALHRFFQSLSTPYLAYQADTPEDIAKAVADVGQHQNFPLDFLEQIPRRDYSRYCVAAAAFFCLMLLVYRSVQLEELGMKRSRMHWAFGLTALGFGLLAAYHGARLQRADHVNEAIASATAAGLDDSVPEARLARLLALSKAGEYDAAVKGYKALTQDGRPDLRLAALYNLGNLHLREALKNGPDSVAAALPLVELAKQSYRDVLRDDPADWDARYNLERALWLAPEIDEALAQDSNPPEWEKRVVLPAPRFKVELP